jgi:hypothetical protein
VASCTIESSCRFYVQQQVGLISNAADFEDRTQEREVYLFFFLSCRTQENVGIERVKRKEQKQAREDIRTTLCRSLDWKKNSSFLFFIFYA